MKAGAAPPGPLAVEVDGRSTTIVASHPRAVTRRRSSTPRKVEGRAKTMFLTYDVPELRSGFGYAEGFATSS